MAIKHVGVIGDKKVVVAYRTLPGDSSHALVIPTAPLSQTYHDELFSVVDSTQGQQAYELATVLAVRKFSDGASMLGALHATNKLQRVATNTVTMQPGPQRESWVKLDELNKIIAEQRGVSIDELAITSTGEPGKTETATTTDGVLSDEDLAAQYRSQADAMFKEAKRLREEAEALSPTKKKTTKKTESA